MTDYTNTSVAAETGQNSDNEQTKQMCFTSKVYLGYLGIVMAMSVFAIAFTALPDIVDWYSFGGGWLIFLNWLIHNILGGKLLANEFPSHAERYMLLAFGFTQASAVGYYQAKYGSLTSWWVLFFTAVLLSSMMLCHIRYPASYAKLQKWRSEPLELSVVGSMAAALLTAFKCYETIAIIGSGIAVFLLIDASIVFAANKYMDKSHVKAITYASICVLAILCIAILLIFSFIR